jgi:two-component system chemotaxis sensor kinase CheA
MARDPYKYFRVEARELLEGLGQGLLELEKGPPPPALVPKLLRLAHTLKGAARVVRLPEIAEMAHAVEDALSPLRDGVQSAGSANVDGALKLLDAIGARVARLAGGNGNGSGGATPPEKPVQTVRTDLVEMDRMLEGISQAGVQLRSLRDGLAAVERARHLTDLMGDQLASPRLSGTVGGRIATVSARTRSLAEELRGVVTALERDLTNGVERIERELRQLRDTAERLRLLPASVLFAALERTTRDTAQELGKRVSFETKGGDVSLDAHVLGAIQGALIQAVRNAVAHGIEIESERIRGGKPAVASVVLEVLRRGRRAVFRCHDDGRGIDVEAVRRAAQDKGLLPPDARDLPPDAVVALLLKGGLTTSGAITEVSGRGVGLDVVREAAARLGGDVSLRTEAGRGTILELVVPISVASLEALVVDCAGVTAAVPLDSVRRTTWTRTGEMIKTPEGYALSHDGAAIPFLPLSRALFPDARPELRARPWSVIVVDSGSGPLAVGVDRLVGTSPLVLRPLPVMAAADPLVAGVWLDAEGNPQVLVDPDGLVEAARSHEATAATPASVASLPLLVVDDSLTTRMLEQSILESAGYEVDLASSAEEALEKARRRRYRMFIVDVEMPGMDGFTFVEVTRADPALREVPAILVTSRNTPEDHRRGAEIGAGAYITKSEFEQTNLLATIRRLTG